MKKIKVVLVGGPAHFPAGERIQFVASLEQPLKHPHCAGYEHFGYSGRQQPHHDEDLPVFEWKGRTTVAE
jgi:hypothetical protein